MYNLEWKEHALKELEKIEPSISRRIIKKVEEMVQNPLSCDIKKLKGYSNYYRLRAGDYRIIFEMSKNLITILKVGHRQNIYD
jgi:mRNA interferase RelE/StbE